MQIVLNHPLVNIRVTELRDENTPPKRFRELVSELTFFLAYDALKDVTTKLRPVTTPVAKTKGAVLTDDFVIVPVLRAGMGMLSPMLEVLPQAKVGVLGLQRNEKTAEPEAYYAKVPRAKKNSVALVIDPMLATGGSAADAIAQLKKLGYKRIKSLHLIAAPEGMKRLKKEHPDAEVYVAQLDERLNERFYIVPGLGDAGDRIFGTVGVC